MRSGIILVVALNWVTSVQAEIVYSDFSGSWDLESRWFPYTALNPGQDSNASSFAANARLYVEDAAGRSFTLEPLLRYDDTDPRRLTIHENGSTPSPPLVLMNRDVHAPHSQPLVFRVNRDIAALDEKLSRDIAELREQMNQGLAALGERVARLEGFMEGLRDAIAGKAA